MRIRFLSRGAPLVFALAFALTLGATRARADDELNELFQAGLVKYKAGAVSEAIRFWEQLYTRAGAEKGYRVAYNLARAYEQFGDATNAASRYEAFLAEVRARRASGKAIEPIVAREEQEAEAQLAEIVAKLGRVHVAPSARAYAVQVDAGDARIAGFTVFVAPGKHVVRFAPGTDVEERRDLDVHAGELVEVAPPEPPSVEDARPPRPPPERTLVPASTTPPFSPVVIYVAGGAALVSTVVPAIAYAHALTLANRHNDSSDAATRYAIEQEYPAAKDTAYATLLIPGVLALGTAALATYYFAKTEDIEAHYAGVPITPIVLPSNGGAVIGALGRF